MAGSVGDRAIKTNLAKSSAPIDNSIACRHAVMTFHPAPRIRSQGTSHDGPRESRTNDWFHGIAELVPFFGGAAVPKTAYQTQGHLGFVALMGAGFSLVPTFWLAAPFC